MKWLVLILFLITAISAFVPCCAFDNCCADQLAATPNHDQHEPEGACSPFFACATCPGFVVEISKSALLLQPLGEKQVHHEQILKFNLTIYASSFWQPPRSC